MKNNIFFKKLIVAFAFLCLHFSGFADKPRVKGYYIDNDGNKIQVLIIVPTGLLSDKVSNQNACYGFDFIDKKNKKTTFYAADIKEYGFTYQGEKYVYQSLSNGEELYIMGIKIKAPFYRLVQDGPVKLFLTYVQHAGANGQTTSSLEYMFWRDYTDTFITGTAMFKRSGKGSNAKSLEDYFADCPELSQKIKNKEYKNGDDRFERIAKFYNTSCKQKAAETSKEESQEEQE
ncbi:MAG: hypothetical protein WCR21_05150 [Bacteroidota bacterium]